MSETVWAYWQAERKAIRGGFVPTIDKPQTQEPTSHTGAIDGTWRVMGARMKHDDPVSIWREAGSDHVVLQVGGRTPRTIDENGEEFMIWRTGTFLKCAAVSDEEWKAALLTRKWADGRDALPTTMEEKQGIDIKPGDNNAPVDEVLKDQIDALAEVIKAIAEPVTQEEANALTEKTDKMRTLLKLAEAERVKAKQPFLDGGREVDAKFGEITGPGAEAYEIGETRRKSYLKKEQARLATIAAAETKKRQEEADAAAAAERKRIADEAAERLARENAEREAAGRPTMDEAEIAEQAAAEAETLVQTPEVEDVQPERATAGSSYGRARRLKRVKRGKITDHQKFAAALVAIKHGDMMTLLQTLADRAAKAGMPVDGMIVEEVLE